MPTFRNFSSGTSTTITVPTGTANGDLLVVILRGTTGHPPVAPSADWTQIGSDITNGGGFEFGAYYATYSGTLALTYTATNSPAFYCWGYQSPWGVPILMAALSNQASSNTGALTFSPAPTSGQELLYGVWTANATMSGWLDPPGWTADSDSGSGMRAHKTSSGTETGVSPGWTSGADWWCGLAIAVPSGVVTKDVTASGKLGQQPTTSITASAKIARFPVASVTAAGRFSIPHSKDVTGSAKLSRTPTKDITASVTLLGAGHKDVAASATMTTLPGKNVAASGLASRVLTHDLTASALVSQAGLASVDGSAVMTLIPSVDVAAGAVFEAAIADIRASALISAYGPLIPTVAIARLRGQPRPAIGRMKRPGG